MALDDYTGSWTPEEGDTPCVQLTKIGSDRLIVDDPEPFGRGVLVVNGIEELPAIPPEDPVRIKIIETNDDGYDEARVIDLDCDQDIENAEVNDWEQVTDPNAERRRERRSNLMDGRL